MQFFQEIYCTLRAHTVKIDDRPEVKVITPFINERNVPGQ